MRTSRWWCGVVLIGFISICPAVNAGSGKSVPVMTVFTVKLDQPVSAKTASNGAPFTATLRQAVEVNGQTIIPAGASAGGVMSKESQSSAQMELNSVFVNGRSYRITTEPVLLNSKSSLPAGATLTFHLMLSFSVAN